MNTESPDHRKESPVAEPDELDRRIAELHQQGILIGGEGPANPCAPSLTSPAP